jgi:hypothetical protein
MIFKLKRPCVSCPFRKGQGEAFRLRPERLQGIVDAVAFTCLDTIDYDYLNDPVRKQGEHPQQCAGLMAMLYRDGKANQMMQIAERLGHLDPAELDPDHEAYGSLEEAIREHRGVGT